MTTGRTLLVQGVFAIAGSILAAVLIEYARRRASAHASGGGLFPQPVAPGQTEV